MSEGFEVLEGPPKWGVVHDRVDRGTQSGSLLGIRWAGDGGMVEGLVTLSTLATRWIWFLVQEVRLGS